MVNYGIPVDKYIQVLKRLITHELIHIENGRELHIITRSNWGKLFWIIFDEGIAHYLSYQDDILSVNWETKDYKDKEKQARIMLQEVLAMNEINEEILETGKTGAYWDKYASICGMFDIKDILLERRETIPKIDEFFRIWYGRLKDTKKFDLTIACT